MGEKRFYWIKLKTDFFNQETIDYILSQTNGCEYIVLYQMICLQTANNNDKLSTNIGEMIIPFDVDKIVRDTKYFNKDTVIVALELFKKLGLVYQDDNGVLSITGYDNMVGSETKAAERQRLHRSKQQKALTMCDNVTTMSQDKSQNNCDIVAIEKEIDKEIEKDIEIESNNTTCYMSTSVDAPKITPADVVAIYHDICKSYPKIRTLSDSRKKAINARLRNHSIEEVKEVFEKAEKSAFLKGSNQRNWSADFDWLMKDANFCKVLDGKYDDKGNTNTYNAPQPQQKPHEETEEEINKRQQEQYLKLCEAFGWNPDEDFEEVEEKSPEERLREIYEEQERVREGRKREWT